MHWFLAQNPNRSRLSPLFDSDIGLCGAHDTKKRPMDGEAENLFRSLGWQDCSCATLARVSGGQRREMQRSIACRCMEKDWAEDLGSKPKLCVLNSVCKGGLDGRCWKMQEKSHRRVLMMLRGGSAPFQIETGRWKGVRREEKLCRECGMNEVKDCDHWLLRCSRWDVERQHLLTNVDKGSLILHLVLMTY